MKKRIITLAKIFALVFGILLILDFVQPILPLPIYPVLFFISGFMLVLMVLDRILSNRTGPLGAFGVVTLFTALLTAGMLQVQLKSKDSQTHGFMSAELCSVGDLQTLVGLTDNPPKHAKRELKAKEKLVKQRSNNTVVTKQDSTLFKSGMLVAIDDPKYKAGTLKLSALHAIKLNYKVLKLKKSIVVKKADVVKKSSVAVKEDEEDDLPPVLSDSEQENLNKLEENLAEKSKKSDSKIDVSNIPDVDLPSYLASLDSKAETSKKSHRQSKKSSSQKVDISKISAADIPSYIASLESNEAKKVLAMLGKNSQSGKKNKTRKSVRSSKLAVKKVKLKDIPAVDLPTYMASLEVSKKVTKKNRAKKNRARKKSKVKANKRKALAKAKAKALAKEEEEDDLPPVLDDVPEIEKIGVLAKKKKSRGKHRIIDGKIRRQILINMDLIEAVAGGNIPLIELTLDRGAEINFRLSKNRKPHLLFRAASTAKAAKIVMLLVKAGADVNDATRSGRTPLFVHTQMNRYAAVMALLNSKANPNLQAKDGSTAVYTAAREGRLRILKLLIKHGGKTNVILRNGKNPLMAAAVNGHKKTVLYLLSKGINPSMRDKKGLSSIDYANGNDHPVIAQLLSLKSK